MNILAYFRSKKSHKSPKSIEFSLSIFELKKNGQLYIGEISIENVSENKPSLMEIF